MKRAKQEERGMKTHLLRFEVHKLPASPVANKAQINLHHSLLCLRWLILGPSQLSPFQQALNPQAKSMMILLSGWSKVEDAFFNEKDVRKNNSLGSS